MYILSFLLALCLIFLVSWEIFETIVLPRKIDRRFRLTRYYYISIWRIYHSAVKRTPDLKSRTSFLSIFGPLSLICLFVFWGICLVFAFALLNWSMHSQFKLPNGEKPSFGLDLYVSGTTLTTLGLGDVTPLAPFLRLVSVIESGLGLGFVALVISYLPALYQAFSRREVEISLLDARAGSPPSAAELLHRYIHTNNLEGFEKLLMDWERWCAEIMESHVSYPVLCFFRSQHTNQSWVMAITAILDTCALCLACLQHKSEAQARLTFAMARHALVDITQVFHQQPSEKMPERLELKQLQSICDSLRQEGWQVRPEQEAWKQLNEMRKLYEPYVFTLSAYLLMDVTPWTHPSGVNDNWIATKWRNRV